MLRIRRNLLSKALLLTGFFFVCEGGLAAKPAALATLSGELRNFSPDGRYAAVVDKDMVAVYETSRWQQVGTIAVGPVSRFHALLIDNQQQLAGVYSTPSNQRRLEIWDFKNGLKSLGAQDIKSDRGAVLSSGGTLAIEAFSQVYMGRSTAYRSPREGILHEGDDYRWFAYRCSVDKYLEAALRLSPVMRREEADAVQRLCSMVDSGSSAGGKAEFEVFQSDLAVSKKVDTMRYTGHPAYGPGEYVRKEGEQKITWFSSTAIYASTDNQPYSPLKKISTPNYVLLSGQPYQVIVTASDDPYIFHLKQLEIPEFVPQRVSPDARLVAFNNGQATKIYAAEVVTDEYANLDPGVKQDLLMQKISNAFTENRPAGALSYLERLAQMGRPLPEIFYYYQLQALVAADKKDKAREQAETYLKKYGKQGKYYGQVISMMARL